MTRPSPFGRRLPLGTLAALLLSVTCNDVNEPTSGALRASVSTTGGDLDLDGYAVAVDTFASYPIGANQAVVIPGLPTGVHDVQLSGVAQNCTLAGQNPRSVSVIAGDTVEVAFTVTCGALTGAIQIAAATSGLDPDTSGYTVQLDGGAPRALAANGLVTITGVTGGDHVVTLAGAEANCTPAGSNPRTVQVTTGGTTRDTARTTFEVTCVATTGVIEVTTVTSGADLDPNGYDIEVDTTSGPRSTIAANGTVRFTGVSGGSHQVYLQVAYISRNCTLSGENPRTLSVSTGSVTRDTVRTTFQITCAALGSIEVRATTTGVDPDPNGYPVVASWTGYSPYFAYADVPASGTVTIPGLVAGDHSVYLDLAGVSMNCGVVGPNQRTVSVPSGGTASVAFEITCAALGRIEVTTRTTGVDPNPNGYLAQVSGRDFGYLQYVEVPASGTVTIPGLVAGDYSVGLGGVTMNCDVVGPNPPTVSVPSGGTVSVAFEITCAALGSIDITAATTGLDLDPNGYRIDAVGERLAQNADVPANGTVTIPGLVAGDYSVTLGGVTMNCDVVGPNPRTVSVPSGGTAAVAFDVTCAQAAQLAVGLSADIYTLKSNGAGLTRLTTDRSSGDPAWSPDGSKIAFHSYRDGNIDIYVVSEDGSGLTRLTTDPAQDAGPDWSPDGSKIAFVSNRDGNGEIYVMSAAGTNPVRLTNHLADDAFPAWSPDGSKIAFMSRRDGNGEIYVMNPDGSGATRLTTNPVEDLWPAWSPDGAKLAFSRLMECDSTSGFCDYDLYVMNADGSGAERLTSGSSEEYPAWSPDGRWIAFQAQVCEGSYYDYTCDYSLQVVRTDGSRVVELLRDAINGLRPAWRP